MGQSQEQKTRHMHDKTNNQTHKTKTTFIQNKDGK